MNKIVKFCFRIGLGIWTATSENELISTIITTTAAAELTTAAETTVAATTTAASAQFLELDGSGSGSTILPADIIFQ